VGLEGFEFRRVGMAVKGTTRASNRHMMNARFGDGSNIEAYRPQLKQSTQAD
jgi:hypothetical protein